MKPHFPLLHRYYVRGHGTERYYCMSRTCYKPREFDILQQRSWQVGATTLWDVIFSGALCVPNLDIHGETLCMAFISCPGQ
jgi:hypothetical protein